MSRSSGLPGTGTSASEVTAIGPLGFWVIAGDAEYFVPFADYPVFRAASVAQIFDVQQLGPTQLHWPELDADIELDALAHPERFPLAWH